MFVDSRPKRDAHHLIYFGSIMAPVTLAQKADAATKKVRMMMSRADAKARTIVPTRGEQRNQIYRLR